MPESYFLHHFLPFGELVSVPPCLEMSCLRQPQANQELEAAPLES